MLGFQKANPKFGEVGHNTEASVPQPLPGCLDTLLNKSILKKAKTDTLAKVLKQIRKEPEVQAVVRARAKELDKAFKGKSSAAHSKTANPLMSMEQFVGQMVERKVAKDVIVHPTPNVSGADVPEVHSNLSQLDIKGAFVTAQEGEGNRDQIDATEFVHILALCGHIKYEEIEAMSLPMRVSAVFANYLGEKDEQAVISEALYPPLVRFDPSTSQPKAGAPYNEHRLLLETWAKMDLSHMFGFPAWEGELFGAFQGAFGELRSIFDYYAKSGTAGSASAGAAMTMQSTELTNLALDCNFVTPAFSMARVNTIFQRADQVDDTFKESAADHRVVEGETAKGGDRGLEHAQCRSNARVLLSLSVSLRRQPHVD
jgi:hypothetical protein